MKLTRRTFVKNIGIITAGLATYSPSIYSKSTESTELNDLYDFIESKTIHHPIKGEIQFKLYPFQKQILTQIHENDRVIFIKGRQIGMSYLTSAYSAWAKTKNKLGKDLRFDSQPMHLLQHRCHIALTDTPGINIYGAFPNFGSRCAWDEKYCRFTGDPIYQYGSRGDLDSYWPYPERFNIVTLDELNWDLDALNLDDSGSFISPSYRLISGFSSEKTQELRIENYTTFQLFLYQLEEEMRIGYIHNTPSCGKIIVCGTPDPYGNLKSTINNPKLRDFKVFYYPVAKCTPLWNEQRITDIMSNEVSYWELNAQI